MHLHIDSLRWKPPHMHLTPEVYEAAARRHPDLAAKLTVTFSWDSEDFEKHMKTTNILFAQRFPKEKLAAMAPELKWLNVPSAGVEYLMPLDWLPEHVVFTNNSGTHGPRAAESVTMAVMMLNSGMPRILANQRACKWEQVHGTVLAGKTAVIVGFGGLGRSSAQALRHFGVCVRAVRRNPAPDPDADTVYGADRLQEALKDADFLIVAAPLTKETHGMIGAAELDCLKRGAGVINVGRGPIVDYDALRARLESCRIGGAFLDVFEPEPLPADSPLWSTRNLVLTPHVSSDDPANYLPRALDIFFDNLRLMQNGQEMNNVIDRSLGY
jgi:phosphoglycerate dehydrogenase-like enzyme